MLRTFVIFGLFLIVPWCSASDTRAKARSVKQADEVPVAILVKVEGSVTIMQGRRRITPAPGLALEQGSQVRCGPKSTATLFLSDAQRVVVEAGKTYAVKDSGPADTKGREMWQRLIATITPMLRNQKYAVPAAPTVRAGPEDTRIPPLDTVQPKEFRDEDGTALTGRVLNNAPVFIFTPQPQARSYRIRITQQGETVLDRTISEPEVVLVDETGMLAVRLNVSTLPSGLLPSGTLRWEVMAGNSETSRTRRSAFRSVEPSTVPHLAPMLSGPKRNEGAVGLLMRAAVCEAESLFGDATLCYLQAIQADPGEELHHRLLARLYDRMELYALSDHELEAAKRLAAQAREGSTSRSQK